MEQRAWGKGDYNPLPDLGEDRGEEGSVAIIALTHI
jgi:hypothetical protein